ncbi:type II secretion system protein J [Verrucomicrobiota bacterium]
MGPFTENRDSLAAGGRRSAFTLIEVLVAMTIMVAIVLMLSSVFHQMTTSWDVGTRKTHVNMQGRAVVDFMAQELSHAVADGVVPCDIGSVGNDIVFYTLNSSSNRALTRVNYFKQGSKLRRKIARIAIDQPYFPTAPLQQGDVGTLLTGVESIQFQAPGNFTTNLPPWVNIVLELRQDERVTAVSGRCRGRDGVMGTPDDIVLE